MSGTIDKNETEITHDANINNDHRNNIFLSSVASVTSTTPENDISKYTKFAQKLEKDPISYLDRYYRKFYFLDPDKEKQEDFYIYRPPNGLCVLGLAPTHPLIQEASKYPHSNSSTTENLEKSITVSIAFNQNVISLIGKKHRPFRPNINLSIINHDKNTSTSITVKEDKKHGDIKDFITKNPKFENYALNIKFPVTGFLVDWNGKIVDNPAYLFEKPSSEGYIAIIKPQKHSPPELENWVTEAEYKKLRFGIIVSTEEPNDQFIVDEQVSSITTTAIHENASIIETDVTDEDIK
ncbi:6851_t:CDS:2 [Ambispora gerdemannii]|uniref:Protein Abitram n=1 Tax=Ambispora gerdemannii TaxID=144530 RepID=A0A9N9AVM9_9GLOM|nr:6851_t:CDS:2 [Ambispora gerdemannii]